ncbi:hypothetical protein GCM10007417_18260 [Glycocaulis alkaliphilus]|nr:hypothetical protein GCM10007417_18260 [Glycocaulis alkaliphilus]
MGGERIRVGITGQMVGKLQPRQRIGTFVSQAAVDRHGVDTSLLAALLAAGRLAAAKPRGQQMRITCRQ